MSDKTCNKCAHFHPTDKDRLAGQCRLYPPTVFMGQQDTHNLWPHVDALDWCSKFMSAENLYEKKKKK